MALDIKVNALLGDAVKQFKDLEGSVYDVGSAVGKQAAAVNKLQLAQVQAANSARILADAEKELGENTSPERQQELAEKVLKARVAFDSARANADKYQNELNQLEAESKQAASAQNELEQETNQAGAGMGRMGALADMAGISMMGLATAALGAGVASVKLAMDAEKTKIAFDTMLGSAEAATDFLDILKKQAASTPFELTDLTELSKKMLALGFSAKEIPSLITDIGDAVAGLSGGPEVLEGITLALGQMQLKGKVSAEEMGQLAERGIPAWTYLATAIGKSVPVTQELASKGLIPVDTAMQAILAGMRQDFGGMMAKQSQTAAGKVSNLTDAVTQLGTAIGEGALPVTEFFTDQLIEAANAANLMVTANKSISKVLEEHAENTMLVSRNYEDYSAEILRAQVAAGRLNESQADTYLIITQLREEYGHLTLAQLQQALANKEITGAEYEALRAYQGNKLAIEEKMIALGLMTQAEFDAQKATENAAQAVEAATARWQGLADTYPVVASQQELLTAAQNSGLDAVTLLDAGLKSYNDTLLFNVATEGMSAAQKLKLGIAMGEVDTRSLLAAQAVETLTKKYDANRDGVISAAEGASGYNAAIIELQKNIALLPDQKTIKINLETTGNIPTLTPGSGITAIPQANGGKWMVNKPTLFLAGEAGPEVAEFTPVRKMGSDSGGGSGGGGGGGSTTSNTLIINTPVAPAIPYEFSQANANAGAN